jgi:hypothetical protein
LTGKDRTEFQAVVATVNFIIELVFRKASTQNSSSPDMTNLYRVIALDELKLLYGIPSLGHPLNSSIFRSEATSAFVDPLPLIGQ